MISFEKFKDYFKFYKGLEHQNKGLKDLYDLLVKEDSDALADTAGWMDTYSTALAPVNPPISGTSVLLTVPYQKQLDNTSGQGQRECFSSSCAMVAMYYKKVKNDDEYNKIRAKYGDTTSADAQVKALRSLGISCEFRTDGTTADLERQIREKKPTPVGWLHHGSVGNPVGGGHWTLALGYDSLHWVMHDPYGEADVVNGGYVNHSKGENIRYSKKNWNPRWRVRNTGGWYIKIL